MSAWEHFADVLLRREAALCRIVAGVPPRDFAGLYVDDGDLDALLRSLPGLDGPDQDATAPVRAAFEAGVRAARADLDRWRRAGTDPLAAVARHAGLDGPAAEVLALVTAVELDPQRQRLVGYVQDSVALPRLTLAVLPRLLGRDHPGPRAVAPGGPLCRSELVRVDGDGPWATRMCGAAARLVWAVLGEPSPDPGLAPGARSRPAARPGPAPEVPGRDGARAGRGGPRVLLLHGADPESRRRRAGELVPGVPMLVTPVPTVPDCWAATVREATVTGAAVLLELGGPLDAASSARVETASHLTFVLSSARELPLETLPARPVEEHAVLHGDADADDWAASMGTGPGARPRLSREQLRLVAHATGRDPTRLDAGVRRLAGGHLDGLATRIRARRGWGDLVLPGLHEAQLRELVARYRRRRTVFGEWGFPAVPSSGVVALFAGPSGTGKTLAAEVAAAELGLDLYKVDLSAVVSKYIGETEKNLERIFTSAAAGDLVLFFDEADALFGKRSEVSNAHDRYANIEVAYLLQRLEAFDGLVVLATNLQRNIDEAFLRRIGVAVTFAAPDEDERRRIWELVFPAGAPVEDLDVGFLARQFKVTGGTIRNAAVGAAFMAADRGTAITMEEVVLAMQREFRKLGHLATESEFERYIDVVRAGR